MNICICIIESLCCTPETNNIVNQLYSNKIQILKRQKKQALITAGANNRLTKNRKREKLKNELTIGALKASTYSWNLGGHVHESGCAHAQERP